MKLEVLFTKKLTDTDVRYRMAFPMENYQQDVFEMPKGELSKQFEVIDMEDNSVKKFTCSKRSKGHPKPVFCKGWIGFVKEKQLLEGDEVIFYKEEDGTGRFTIKIQARKIPCMVLGQDFRGFIRTSTYCRQHGANDN
ncbi:hypothetical protein GH714_020150 [Hevea brasiliensis]|uniref:Uncharacterized protein n=1 Tax=Hevea brasiliensis TaxID=3981 RepID=A0A6A6N5V8_HEVBR|nr:hypothetical protein GH714_020150 [Hevea brasiliensis]